MILSENGKDLTMSKKMGPEEVLDSIKAAWESSEGLSWELAGQVLAVIIVAALTVYVAKHAKKFKDKL